MGYSASDSFGLGIVKAGLHYIKREYYGHKESSRIRAETESKENRLKIGLIFFFFQLIDLNIVKLNL